MPKSFRVQKCGQYFLSDVLCIFCVSDDHMGTFICEEFGLKEHRCFRMDMYLVLKHVSSTTVFNSRETDFKLLMLWIV